NFSSAEGRIFTNGATASTINSIITGSSGVTYGGSGTLSLPNANAYSNTNAIQTINFNSTLSTITGGSATLSFNGATTTIAISGTSNTAQFIANIQAALDALPTIGQGNTLVAGVGGGTTVTIAFQNALAGATLPTM